MTQSEVILHTLQYSKADLDKIPANDRTFFFMATGLANDIQMLNKALAVIVDNGDWDSSTIIRQGNSAFGMLILRMLAGRLREGWKLISKFSKTLKSDYENEMSDEERAALQELRSYFNQGKGKTPLIVAVRDNVAYHSLSEAFEAAYSSLNAENELGDYLHQKIGNTLYYTTELLQYETLKNLSGVDDHEVALQKLLRDTQQQTSHFNSAIYGFAVVFFERYIPLALKKLRYDAETIRVPRFEDLRLEYFSELPVQSPLGAGSKSHQ